MSESFDMNRLLRGEVQDDDRGEDDEGESVGGKADAGAGGEREFQGKTDMNALLRDAAFGPQERGA